ncbi:MAG: HAD family phosphatase [Selenomonadaceae bacterium]|nr:HAD family phosphatase [Selenomonadaceae bacterium]MBQ1915419.1 HAD family phosphatase [Selenomonadaceae bacterium]
MGYQYRLLALDLDGTTLDSQKRFPAETAEAIRELTGKGIHVAVATGRGLAELSDYREELSSTSYAVAISGGLVYDFRQEKPLFLQALPLEASLEIIAAGEAEKAMVHILSVRESVCRTSNIERMKDFHMEVYQDMYERICRRQDDLAGYVREHADEVVKINLYHRSVESRQRNCEKLAKLGLTWMFSEVTGLEMSPKGITKAKGLEVLCRHLGIGLESVVAVGDAPNDVDILKLVGMPVAMGNATEEVKVICRDVVSDNDHNGVMEAIRRYF